MITNPPNNGNGHDPRPLPRGGLTPADVPPPPADDTPRPAPRSPRAALEPERVPPPKLRSKRGRHPLIVAGNAIFTILALLALGAGAAAVVGQQRLSEPGPLTEEKSITIPRGSGVRDISDLLEREGVIRHPIVFIVGALASRESLKAGEYDFPKQVSLRDVIDTIVEGRVVQHFFTIPEGLTSEQIVARLNESTDLTGTIRETPREGTMLPETYKYTRGTSREQLIQRMQQAQRNILQQVWERRMPDLPVRTPEQLVVLASIVEKETGRPEERTRVASVFVNRLRNRMRLQSDPTIIYGLSAGKGTLGRPILRSEIDQPTPYNTYVIDGLPPGPIANPGRASLEAAASPARTKELYFVADGTGGHVFAENYEQHQRNVARLRVMEREAQPAAQSPAVPTPPALRPSR